MRHITYIFAFFILIFFLQIVSFLICAEGTLDMFLTEEQPTLSLS